MAQQRASEAFFRIFRRYQLSCFSQHRHITTSSHRRPDGRHISPATCSGQLYTYCARAAYSSNVTTTEAGTPEEILDRDYAQSSGQSLYITPDNVVPKSMPPSIRRLDQKHPQLRLFSLWKKLERKARSPDLPAGKLVSKSLQRLMRSMPHSTVLITADNPHHQKVDHSSSAPLFYESFRGAVISSMTTVTLGPPALISFNLKVPSETLSAILLRQRFTVHFLEASPEGAYVAQTFLKHRGDHKAAFVQLSKSHQIDTVSRYRISNKRSATRLVAPVIQGKGVISHIVCEVLKEKCVRHVGDHTIIVAKVTDERYASNNDLSDQGQANEESDHSPLLMYSQQEFKAHGNPISLSENFVPEFPEDVATMLNDSNLKNSDAFRLQTPSSASEHPLYTAANRYMNDVIAKHLHRGEGSRALVDMRNRSYEDADSRARFMTALRFWRFERKNGEAAAVEEDDPNHKDIYSVLAETQDDIILDEVADAMASWTSASSTGHRSTAVKEAQEARKLKKNTDKVLTGNMAEQHPRTGKDALRTRSRNNKQVKLADPVAKARKTIIRGMLRLGDSELGEVAKFVARKRHEAKEASMGSGSEGRGVEDRFAEDLGELVDIESVLADASRLGEDLGKEPPVENETLREKTTGGR